MVTRTTGPDGMAEPRALVRTWPQAQVPAAVRAQIAVLQDGAWPGHDPCRPGVIHDPVLGPVSMVLADDGTVLATLDILTKHIAHDGGSYLASGLSTVVTSPAHRRRGYGRRLVSAARDAIEASGADLGIFTCDRPLRGFYESAGWHCLEGTVLIGGTPQQPFPSDQFGKVTMAAFFSARARADAASFRHRRIGLYPGTIDRLW
jgi:aminoglycoside 2'-N-acetyltransferase I